ncbi:MAG: pyridoxal 5'-phosphate synthase glutaminase subunit PdxT [Candidatus Dormibacteria bacterium]
MAALERAGAAAQMVRTAAELADVDALVLPGGESTTMSRVLRVFSLEVPLRRRLEEGMPTLSTCAGLILLSRDVVDGRADQLTFGAFDVVTRRNAYGRQVDSFETPLHVDPLGVAPFEGVFIRAPQIESIGDGVEVIAELDDRPVAVQQGIHIGLTFHPEMTNDDRLHRYFVERVDEALGANVA